RVRPFERFGRARLLPSRDLSGSAGASPSRRKFSHCKRGTCEGPMSFLDFIKRIFQPADEGMERSEPAPKTGEIAQGRPSRPGLPLGELARRLKMTEEDLRQVEPIYHEFA